MFHILMNAGQQAAQQPVEQPGWMGGITSFVPFIFLILILYFLMIRPQQKKQKELQKMLDELKIGDEIVTNGGIFGKITNFRKEKDSVIIKTEENKIEIQRAAIAGLVSERNQ